MKMGRQIMKRIFTWLLIISMLLGLCACGSNAPTWQEQYDLGVRYLEEGSYEEAIIAFTAAIEIDPKRAEAYVGRGDAYIAFGETEENLAAAQADYERAIELDETCVDAYLKLADIYTTLKDTDAAIAILEQGIEITGDKIIESKLKDIMDGMSPNLDQIFDDPLSLDEISSNGLPIQACTPENNPSAFLLGNRIYIVDESLHIRGLTCGMSKTDVYEVIGLTEYGIECCEKYEDVFITLENGECTGFSEMEFDDIPKAIVIEMNNGAVGLLLGFENDILTYLECDLPI